ncbi:response regulator with CheY-like receiver domain and winged-helix DNA-binding domain [Desulfosporosinus orientis DSM 765]|uniref:Stage 0 sporulation protein A homolog n=1 Tax=Desulfosporosinus orientis (strain ATCC 19365 / DSM 765 / NCIMB 8382 / VKM B-1628 / Singapore I) TaxID=768706 RepID=G7WFK3_DESOD|nr:response regulator transcription factor [Desulfosporosinus orientis]AET68446.1 response regulator with CheY-like receiver domain and winged-helix DNA-binding domain [Desulfosporosinus orientis DSM 765]
MRLLLVDDEQRLADPLAYILRKNNYGVDLAYDGETGQAMAETGIYDLIVLDRMLPNKEGVEVLKELRNKGIMTPVLLLTAKDSVEDRITGLDAGADDYLIKPFSTDELMARIRALSRRKGFQLTGDKVMAFGLVLDPFGCEVTDGKNSIKLTYKESLLLELFMRNPSQVITKEQILDRVWGLDSDVELSNVEVYIYYLRKKIKSDHCSIETIRGVGYCLKGLENSARQS